MTDDLWAQAGRAAEIAEGVAENGGLLPHDGTLAAFAARDLRRAAARPSAGWTPDGLEAALCMADLLEALWQFGLSAGRREAGFTRPADPEGAARTAGADEVDLAELARAAGRLLSAMPQAWTSAAVDPDRGPPAASGSAA